MGRAGCGAGWIVGAVPAVADRFIARWATVDCRDSGDGGAVVWPVRPRGRDELTADYRVSFAGHRRCRYGLRAVCEQECLFVSRGIPDRLGTRTVGITSPTRLAACQSRRQWTGRHRLWIYVDDRPVVDVD